MKRKMIQKNLINNAIQAYFAAVEIHNKPKIEYRYETTSILLINAWELILKAFVRKYIKNRNIFKQKDRKNKTNETIPLKVANAYCLEYLNSIDKNNFFKSTSKNISRIEEYRDSYIHFYDEKIEPVIFSLISKSSYDFVKFLKTYFDKDIIDDERMYIMPIGFKLPFEPMQFFTNEYAESTNSDVCKEFIKNTIKSIEELKEEGIEDSIVLGFNVKIENVKNIKNSDFLVAIDNEKGKKITVNKTKKVIISEDKGAQPVFISPEEFYEKYPYTYTKVRSEYKKLNPEVNVGTVFSGFMDMAKSNPVLAGTLGKHPESKSKSKPSYCYSNKIFAFLDEKYFK